MFGRLKKNRDRDEERQRKVSESQQRLLSAAISTADAAQSVTTLLKSKLDEIVAQFDSTARILKDALFICDASGIIQTTNPAAEKMFGVNAKRGEPIDKLFQGGRDEIINAAHLWVLLQNEDQEDVNGRRDTGALFNVRVSFSMLERDGGGSSVLLLVQDVSQEKITSRNLLAANKRYQSIFETSFDGIIIAKDGFIVAANPACHRLFGYPLDQITGSPVSVLVADRERNRLSDILTLPFQDTNPHYVVEGMHESGRHLTLVFTVTEITWENEVAVLTTIRDVTEMRRLEQIVAMKRDNGVDMICCFDPSFRITYVNQTFAGFYNERVRDLIGRDVRDFVPDRDVYTETITALSREKSSFRSFIEEKDVFHDWIDHGIFDEAGNALEFHRVGRAIENDLAQAIKGQ